MSYVIIECYTEVKEYDIIIEDVYYDILFISKLILLLNLIEIIQFISLWGKQFKSKYWVIITFKFFNHQPPLLYHELYYTMINKTNIYFILQKI